MKTVAPAVAIKVQVPSVPVVVCAAGDEPTTNMVAPEIGGFVFPAPLPSVSVPLTATSGALARSGCAPLARSSWLPPPSSFVVLLLPHAASSKIAVRPRLLMLILHERIESEHSAVRRHESIARAFINEVLIPSNEVAYCTVKVATGNADR